MPTSPPARPTHHTGCRSVLAVPGVSRLDVVTLLAFPQVLSADLPLGALVETVELPVDVDRLATSTVALAKRRGEPLVRRQPNAIGVEIDVADQLRLS